MTKALKEENVRVTMELHDLDHHVLSILGEDYVRSKEAFPLQRYELLKTMIKSAIQASIPENLQNSQKSFGEAAKSLRLKEETKRGLKNMSKDEIEANTATKRVQIEIIRGLAKDYAAGKGVFPVRRYFLMKRMVRRRILQRPQTL